MFESTWEGPPSGSRGADGGQGAGGSGGRRLVCCFPGCTRRAFRGSPEYGVRYPPGVEESDLRPLCRRHYRLVQHGGWRVARNPDGSFTWTSPLGRHYHGSSHPEDENE